MPARTAVVAALCCAAIAAAGCSPSAPERRGGRVLAPGLDPEPSTGSKAAGPGPAVPLPDPDGALPRRPARIAAAVTETEAALNSEIRRWRAAGARPGSPVTRRLLVRAVYRQRIYRRLGASTGLESRVLARLPRRLRSEVRANVAAGRELRSLVVPQPPPVRKRKIHRPLPPQRLIGLYKKAQARFGVRWQTLAGVNFVESKFGRILGPSSAGAQGPMQFIPSTWAAYGMGGDVMDPHDSIMGAANYLSASGAPGEIDRALYAYNPAPEYVRAVRLYTRQITRDRRNFFDYYFWQVFFATTEGDVVLADPQMRAVLNE